MTTTLLVSLRVASRSGPRPPPLPPTRVSTRWPFLSFFYPPLASVVPFASSRPGPRPYVPPPPLNDRLRPSYLRGPAEGQMRGDRWRARWNGDRHGRARWCREMERASGFVGNWDMWDLLRARFRGKKKRSGFAFPSSSCLAKKKKTLKKMRSDIVNVHRAAIMQHAGLLGEAWELGRLALKVKATLSCPESILTFRIN